MKREVSLALPRQSSHAIRNDLPDAALAAGSVDGLSFDWAWYEGQLARDERRRRGHYSTPPDLVARILDWAGYAAGADLEHLTMLDPACGSGNFLAAAAETLIAHGRSRQWSPERILNTLQANLWGLEADPIASALADLRLRALARQLAPRQPLHLHIHQADALALAAAPRYQLVVGNPPYLAARKHYLQVYQQEYFSAGQRDAYLLFLEQACRFVAPGGWLGLVLPDPMLARANAADARRLLREQFTITRLLHLKGVFRAEVGTLVLIAQRVAAPALFAISWSRLDWKQAAQEADSRSGAFACEVWRQQPRAELRYLLGPAEARLFERLVREVCSAPLGDLVEISRGEETAKGAARPLPEQEAGEDALPVLRGGLDVRPFHYQFAGVYLRRSQILKPLERYRAPKLLVVKSTGMLSAALDEQGYVALQTLYLLHLKSEQMPPGYLLALLNSRLLRGYLWLYHTAYKLVQPQIEQEALARMPLPLAAVEQQQEIAALANHLPECYQEFDQRKRLAGKLAVETALRSASPIEIGATGVPPPGPPERTPTSPTDVSARSNGAGGTRVGGFGGRRPVAANLFAGVGGADLAEVACENEAAWIQLQQRIQALSTRLNSAIAALCGLTADEQALLERLPVQ